MSADVELAGPGAGVALDPPYDYDDYRSTRLRAPRRPLLPMPDGETERRGRLFGEGVVTASDSDLTISPGGEPIGERIIVSGRVTGSGGEAGPPSARGDLAGQRGRPLPSRSR